MFPAGAPGAALLMLRVCVAAMLLLVAFPVAHGSGVTWQFVLLSALCILLCVGMFTPVACILSIVLMAVRLPLLADRETIRSLLTLVVTLCLALLGPGSFSIDALLFGRRIIPTSQGG